jgi:hypothetical protein
MHRHVMSCGNACSTCLWGACISLRHHRPMHGLTAWDLKFQVCLGCTFTTATLGNSGLFIRCLWMRALKKKIFTPSLIVVLKETEWRSLFDDAVIQQLKSKHFGSKLFQFQLKCRNRWNLDNQCPKLLSKYCIFLVPKLLQQEFANPEKSLVVT